MSQSNNCDFFARGDRPSSRAADPARLSVGHIRACKDGSCEALEILKWISSSEAWLEVLLGPAIQPSQRLIQIFEGVGDAKSQVALAKIAECSSGKAGDTGIFEQRICQLFRFPPCLHYVRENVECAFWQAA